MASNEREIIYESLIEIVENGSFSHVVEKNVLDKYDYLESVEKAFIKRVIEGTIENQLIIDDVINDYSKVKCNKLKPAIRTILRMSIYQILFMDKVPDSAACNEAVKIATRHGFKSLSGFVNGVLRNIARNKTSIKIDTNNAFPEWIVDHFESNYGKDISEKILKSMQEESLVTIRVRDELSDYGGLLKVKDFDDAYYVSKGKSIYDIDGYESGKFIVQDLSAQRVMKFSGIKENDMVLDLCASPGGKAIHAADLGGIVRARDLTDDKILRIDENIERCNMSNKKVDITTEAFDAAVFDESSVGRYDVVIADLPCSGLGVMGRKADIRFKTKKEDLNALVSIQRDILTNAWQYLKQGGKLIYSTCTINKDENENQVKWMIEKFPLELISEKQYFPGIDEGDGFYIAQLIRK